jgi:hypothetical protein
MAKLASVEFGGQSGTKYSFNVYPIDSNFNEIGGVYCFSKRTLNNEGTGNHSVFYIGITNDFSTRFIDHHKIDCAVKKGANCICIHQDENDKSRQEKERDLIASQKPCCNENLK